MTDFYYDAPPPRVNVQSAQMIGDRAAMEDRVVDIGFQVPGQGTVHLCAVLDGHGGKEVSTAIAVALTAFAPGMVMIAGLEKVLSEHNGETLCAIIDRCVTSAEKQLGERVFGIVGTTLVCTLAASSPLIGGGGGGGAWHVSWASIGDSAIFFVPCDPSRAAVQVNVEHTPANLAERERVLKTGGVFCPSGYLRNANGLRGLGLMMTRAIGDKVLEPAGIVSVPDTGMFYANHGDRVVLVSDGVTDALGNDPAWRVPVLVSSIDPTVFKSPAFNAVFAATCLLAPHADNATCIVQTF